jgi:hypothetical protein
VNLKSWRLLLDARRHFAGRLWEELRDMQLATMNSSEERAEEIEARLRSRGYQLLVDNSAVIDVVRKGTLGSKALRHLEVRHMFVVDCVQNGYLRITHVISEENRADLYTKSMEGQVLKVQCKLNGLVPRDKSSPSGSEGSRDDRLASLHEEYMKDEHDDYEFVMLRSRAE